MSMEIIAGYYTDKGQTKKINQDSLGIRIVDSPQGKIAFAIICDGMGGLQQGELASKEMVIALNNWFATEFAQMIEQDEFSARNLVNQWEALIIAANKRISEYAEEHRMMMGTTVSALLIYKEKYYVCHVGDSRIYEIGKDIWQVTEDHTLVALEVKLGKLTPEQAKKDTRRNILLQCVGASEKVEPQFACGAIEEDTTFLLSSDGLVHEISEEELYQTFKPQKIKHQQKADEKCEAVTRLVMERGERDNISVIALVVKKSAKEHSRQKGTQ